ncbi:LysR family transcriptional regulator [Novosphingobium resinovorum]|uniref:LysR family transcriptional regulator n=1 Tax=Novosphingobium resinovorum TaxID=158500 RepID=A0A031JUF7_9SPHN|nr:LysR substrate-binding domain-containing protein [Novosphingobium resinovorum]AOR79468.1 LysR family transcriptional regulator [Novosphingobium resinovorum]EZP80590.1 LysR family transcriptional regulator [Novosphingobium resinovorum]
MELRHLRYFICVAEELHFGAAARRLGISQPPLSQQVRALEDELGVRLFERTSRSVKLTRAGLHFLPHARETLAQADRAARIARLADSGEVGRLSLGFSPSVPFTPYVVDALARFRAKFPEVSVELHELPREDQISGVERRTLDIGILRAFSPLTLLPQMQMLPLQCEGMMLAMRRDHPFTRYDRPLTLADIEGEQLILFSSMNGAGFNEMLGLHCEELGFRPTVSLEADSFGTLVGLTAAGLGITILSRSLARFNVDTLTFRSIEMPFSSQLLMLHLRDASPTTRNFRSLIELSGE